MTNVYFPVFLNLEGKLCVVIGGGKVGERKVLSLLQAKAFVKLISPEATPVLQKLAEEGQILWEKRIYQPGDLEGAWLVVAATNDPSTQRSIYDEANAKRVFCNMVDVPEFCSFIVPSVVKRGSLTIAISTSGASPAVARRIRESLEMQFGPEYEIYLKLMENLRKQILELNLSPTEKEIKLHRLAMAPIPQYIRNRDLDLLKTIIEKEGLIFPSELFES
ncbi:MAG TPA: bifunctional precorrin-2 dehydrogenase/sirohydrochlorin ferrochelatase [Thermodesulfobacterium commune]|uniref:precorrin-2 dehydrogenase n=1 Tax=Thermodesulfobacterium commune TaxID=1741 RepID=A0A3B8N5J5_9BACT|nr:bifunctional precorrin-2 dehydrogenase/sirohydrochlorin ferrochelatase [Thermodesulfobacterium commune]HBT04589.1 bifunctional precorrin-2 dehydrogenase/sirohydrochlorin ferrochelatase [Thermodesulfobacterium commune]HCE80139.1 bifunctional precorrin-2 dehydrogenase/sirohydrochlorin ferrochelatase [Thermodesulfobacterium commune]HCP09543.1 bifunctional precorrin-2 dehydrogenase/sirohydrochlorin ferrochelatase [Thermodesulfobacterium commune]